MTGTHKRSPEGTVAARVWRVVKQYGPIGASDVAKRVGIRRESATSALYKLRKRDRVSLTGVAQWALFTAIGTLPPRDRRGKAKGCRNHDYRHVIAMCTARYGPTWRPPIRPAIELERMWPMAPERRA